jgi:hypothetical protein
MATVAVFGTGLAALAVAAVAVADPSPPYQFTGSPAGNTDDPNSDGAAPSSDRGSLNPLHYNEHPITVPANEENERMTVRVTWDSTAASDWDLLVFRDVNGDGHAQSDEPLEDSSLQEAGAAEEVKVNGLTPSAKYVARVVNFSATVPYQGTVTYRADPPQTTITKRPPDKTDKSTVKFRFVSDEPGSTFQCKADNKPFTPCSSPKELRRLDEGRHTFRVRAVDPAGNEDPTPAKDEFKVVD